MSTPSVVSVARIGASGQAGGPAAVDRDDGSGHERGAVGREERRNFPLLSRVCGPAQRGLAESSRSTSVGTVWLSSVSVNPGAMTLARMPCGPYSDAIA